MREDITSIPISEVFEPRDGCPICRMRDMLEARVVDYITGAAMMEPDVRIETNKQGFCFPHYQMMLAKRNRLGVALMLESHLDELDKQIFAGLPLLGKSGKKQGKDAGQAAGSCFICRQVDWAMERMLDSVCRLWENERDFRRLFEEQPVLCLPHFSRLTEVAGLKMSKKYAPDFAKAAAALCRNYLTELRGDVSHFRKLLDYAEAGDNIGALLRGIQKTEVERGQVLAKPGSIHPHTKFHGQVYVLKKEEGGRHTPFFNNYRPQFYFRTTDVTGVITLPEGTEMCMPGDNVEMDVELITPIAIEEGLRFAIREGGRTVGSGVVTAINA